MPDGLPMWVVYDHPTDYPDRLVARYWDGTRPTATILTDHDLVSLRHKIRAEGPDLIRFMRAPEDDPKILEVWV